jgi:dipeptidyl-peptidase-4
VSDNLSFLRDQIRTQRFTVGIPKSFKVARDASRVLFLRAESGTDRRQSLWVLETASGVERKLVDVTALLSGQEELSPQERARRERARESSAGVVAFDTDASCARAVFSLSGKLYLLEVETESISELADGSVIDPHLTESGTRVAYVSGGALRVIDLLTREDRVLIEDTDQDISWGSAEFIAAEEMSRSRGYWWSPDGDYVLAQRNDQSGVQRWTISDPANPESPASRVAYPAAGTANAEISLSFLGLDGSRVDVKQGDWEYLAAVHWSAGGKPLISVQSRDQRRLEVREVDPADGGTRVLHTESDSRWTDIVTGVPAWTSDGRLVVVGILDGATRLIVDGKPITDTNTQVREVIHVGDEILFSAWKEDSTQIHLYRTEHGQVRPLSTSEGVHTAAGTASATVVVSRSLTDPAFKVSVLRDAESIGAIESTAMDPGIELNLRWLSLGSRRLRAALLLPAGYDETGDKLPVLLDPYGGPHAQRVLHSYHAFLTPQWLANQGFAVLVVDGRGSPGRGPEWEREIFGELASVPLQDQVDALHDAAAKFPVLDLDRVAIRGWSYGGYLSALAVLRRPDVFHAAIAGAPVTDWTLYDTHYTERYLGLPAENQESYQRNSLLADAAQLRRSLLLIHGLADDNVFVAHSLRLAAALLAAGRLATFLPLVGLTHMAAGAEDAAVNLMVTQIHWLKRELAQGS